MPDSGERSRIPPVLGAKSRSRGKIQLRCGQGRMALARSQRQSVVPLTWATNLARPPGEYRPGTAKRVAIRGNGEAHRRELLLAPRRWLGKRAGRPLRGCSSRPGRRARANRLRHLLTICRGVSKRAAMMSLDRPWAARRTILARMTSRYDNVYLCALASSSFCSSLVRTM